LAQENFFSTDGSTTTTKESAPNEPPYNGTENDEFSELEKSSQESIQAEEDYAPEIAAPTPKKNFSGVKESPEKWKPYQRVPEEKRLDELSEKGLFKITKKGEYLYNVDASPQKSASSFKFGMASFPNLTNPASTVSFEQIYGDDKKPVLLIDYEWQFFQSFGKLGLKVGSGLMLASGKGQFTQPFTPPSTGIPTTDAMEKYNFYMFPNSIAAVYRLDIFNRQWIVPYGEVGIDYVTFIEARDDGADFKFGGAPHFHFALGGSFLLDTLGRDMMAEIDRQYGVNHLWLTAEYRRLESMGSDFDFSDDIINGGIMVEF
ncbi:MAG: MXAN_2562 family outer membrane beta-barrel protein, partial [Bdellovibrionota bacterium]